jgi:hypothetical protein
VGEAHCWIDTELVTSTDRHPGFKYLRANIPRIIRATSPLELAVDAIVAGLERRRARVVAPGRSRLLLMMRWPLALKLAADARKTMPEIEHLCAEEVSRFGGAAAVPNTDPLRAPPARPPAAGAR